MGTINRQRFEWCEESVRCDAFRGAFDFAGGGSFDFKEYPMVKEPGDYNLKYLVAAGVLDDQVGPTQLEGARIQSPLPAVLAAMPQA
jgi:2-methylcitrate dehydratase